LKLDLKKIFRRFLPKPFSFRTVEADIKNVGLNDDAIVQGVLATNGVGPCWAGVVFLANNKIYMTHIPGVAVPKDASFTSAQEALEDMVEGLYEKMQEVGEILAIESVCLLGVMVKTMCLAPSETLRFRIDNRELTDRMLDFMKKIIYIDLTMNCTTKTWNPIEEISLESDLTIIAESFFNVRCVSIIMYVGNKKLNVYILDPTKSRSALFSKLVHSELSAFENMVQMKEMAFFDYSDIRLLTPDMDIYNCVQHCLDHVLNELIPQIELTE
jgi:hypothetical protein